MLCEKRALQVIIIGEAAKKVRGNYVEFTHVLQISITSRI